MCFLVLFLLSHVLLPVSSLSVLLLLWLVLFLVVSGASVVPAVLATGSAPATRNAHQPIYSEGLIDDALLVIISCFRIALCTPRERTNDHKCAPAHILGGLNRRYPARHHSLFSRIALAHAQGARR